ncbi:ATP-binding protein [Cytobacillus gottheilii]|nr:ATP-binding protein [Cytobacillus gottheilii]
MVTVASSPARADQADVYKNVDAYVATFERQFDAEGERIKSLYLFSESPGTGKTTTAAAILNEWLVAHYTGSIQRGQQALQRPAHWLDVNEFQTQYNLATMTNDESAMAAIKTVIQRTQQAPFAVLDDIGVRSASEAFRSYLHAIINHRTANGLPTVYTSNLPIEDMAQVFDARLYDRMRDQCAVLAFAGQSKRGMRR